MMVVDWHKFHKDVNLIANNIPNVILLLEQINASPFTCCAGKSFLFFLDNC
jgi:hypothetical protein